MVQILKKELVRKSLHVLIAFLPLIVRSSQEQAVILLGIGSAVYCLSEYLRLTGRYEGNVLLRCFRPIISTTEYVSRGNEKTGFMKSPLTLALGALLSIYLFPFTAMKLGIFALAFGDTAAALLGSTLPVKGIPYLRKKSLGGMAGCFTATFIASFVVLGSAGSALLIALAATAVETLPLRDFDNACIPVFVGWVASALI